MPREEFAARNRFAAQTFGARADQISLLYVLHYIHSAGSYTLLESMDGGAQQDRIDGGSQAVSLALRSKLGDSLGLASPVPTTRGWTTSGPLQAVQPQATVQAAGVI